jgi:predicted TIM-barrel fold metal-dependent hydrolase
MTEVLGPLFSVDDHIVEQPNLYVDRVPAKFRDRAPRMVREKGDEYWVFDGERVPTYGAGLESAAGRDPRTWRIDPAFHLDDMRPGCFDPAARLLDMDLDGIAVQTLFPSALARFVGDRFLHHPDKELAAVCMRAYNDFMLEVWRAEDPDRFIPVMLLPLWDPAAAAAELERTVALGAQTVAGAMQLHNLGYPYSYEPHWDPMWSAVSETGIPVSCHSHTTAIPMPGQTRGQSVIPGSVGIGFGAMTATTEMLFTPQLFERWPKLQFLVTEGGIGWVPFVLERAEWTWEAHRWWLGMGEDARHPIDIFREHFTVCFIEDQCGLALRDRIGIDRICCETDYPHTDTSWPNSREKLSRGLKDATEDEVYRITRGNAERLFKHPIPDELAQRLSATV